MSFPALTIRSTNKEPELKCIVRVRESYYPSAKGFKYTKEIYELRRLSDLTLSDMGCEELQYIENFHDVEDGIYQLCCTPSIRCPWTGDYDGGELYLIPYKPEE